MKESKKELRRVCEGDQDVLIHAQNFQRTNSIKGNKQNIPMLVVGRISKQCNGSTQILRIWNPWKVFYFSWCIKWKQKEPWTFDHCFLLNFGIVEYNGYIEMNLY